MMSTKGSSRQSPEAASDATCRHCGEPIKPYRFSATGYAHVTLDLIVCADQLYYEVGPRKAAQPKDQSDACEKRPYPPGAEG